MDEQSNRTVVRERRRASGLARTVFIAAATLAFVLLAFAVYQYLQMDPQQAKEAARPLAGVLTPPPELMTDNAAPVGVGSQQFIGDGDRATFTLYPRQGTRAIGEIEAENWKSIDDMGRRLRLTKPVIRAETRDGRRVNVRADEAIVEPREPGGFDPQRGDFTGSVVIEIDRLTRTQREALPVEQQDRFDEERVIRINLDRLEFDLEFMRASVTGEFTVHAYELDLRAADLEVRFDTTASRIDVLTTQRGGRLELRGLEDEVTFSLTGASPPPKPSSPLSRMIQTAREQTAHALTPAPEPAPQVRRKPSRPYIDAEGALVLVPYEAPETGGHDPVTYEARFADAVSITQETGGSPSSRIAADVIRVIRAVTEADRASADVARKENRDATPNVETADPDNRIILTWAGPLSLEALETESPPAARRVQIIATGSPVEVWDARGQAECSELVYDSVDNHVRLAGGADAPARLAGERQGTIVAAAIESRATDNGRSLTATGPGALMSQPPAGESGGATDSPLGVSHDARIDFATRLDATLRNVERRGVGLHARQAGGSTALALESARLTGEVSMRQEESQVNADLIDLTFDPATGTSSIKRLDGHGSVLMVHGADGEGRIECDGIEVHFDTSASSPTPTHATARGAVTATHMERTIEAADRMEFVFRKSWRAPGGSELLEEFNSALDRNVTPNPADLNARLARSNRATPAVELASLHAYDDVSVRDPSRNMEAAAERLTCMLRDGNTMTTADLWGDGAAPAHFRSETFTVTGDRLIIDADKEEADVPGPGRMSFQLRKDLDGRAVDQPVPVAIEWRDWMKYRGRENRAIFQGRTHTVSEQTWFDCHRLEIEFTDVEPLPPSAREKLAAAAAQLASADAARRAAAGLVSGPPLVAAPLALMKAGRQPRPADSTPTQFQKEPTYFLATGEVKAVMSNANGSTGRLDSRVLIEGPVLSVNLRDDASMMRVEGAGKLQIEDFVEPGAPAGSRTRDNAGRLGSTLISGAEGDSRTLITWNDLMYYDSNAGRAQFEGETQLDHYSGVYLPGEFRDAAASTADATTGQEAHLFSRVLAIEFETAGDAESSGPGGRESQRVAGLSAAELKQFRAIGAVSMTYERPGRNYWLEAEELTYRKSRELLFIQGSARQPAEFITQSPGAPPRPYSAATLTVDLATERVDAINPTFTGS